VAVVALAAQGHEKLPGLAGAGIGADTHKGVLAPALDQTAPGGGDDFGGGEGSGHQC
jgi:hypothetical protein